MVDGLDECGVNAAEVTELLTSLNRAGQATNTKTLFLSRNHVEIRESLDDYTEIAIAAKSSDLRLYVGAEIDARTRDHKLRIKDQSLKEHIMEKLVEGADGMYVLIPKVLPSVQAVFHAPTRSLLQELQALPSKQESSLPAHGIVLFESGETLTGLYC